MKYKIGIGIVITLIIGFIIGQFIPIEYLNPKIDIKPIESKDFYNLIVQIIVATATFFAVIAALFREEIRKWWEYVEIDYSIPEEKFIEVIDTNMGNPDEGHSQPIEAEKYLCAIELENTGTITSHSSEIVLESVFFKNDNYNTPQLIETVGVPLNWGNANESKVTIPPKGKKRIIVLEVNPPETESSPDGSETVSLPKILISGIETEIIENNGTWTVTYLVYSSNSKPKRFSLEIKWNGKWHGRLTEMKKCLTIDLKS